MSHSRNIVRLAILSVLISISMFHMPVANRQAKASASEAPAAPLSSAAAAQNITTGHFLAVGENADGRLEVFAVAQYNALWHKWQLTPGGAWSGWNSLGGASELSPAVGRNADGRLEIFALGPGKEVLHNWQTSPGGGWSGWNSL